jgi:hypothetical protein
MWDFRGHSASLRAVSAALSTPIASPDLSECPETIAEFVRRALDAVRNALGYELQFDSDTLPFLDHYLRDLPSKSPETAALISAMAGAYFGEAVRRCMGGEWKSETEEPSQWRVVLPGGLSFSPVRLALAAILEDESGEGNADFQAPPLLMEVLEEAMERMGSVSAREYYQLSCRFDTLEHLKEVMLAFAADKSQAMN